MTAMTAIAATAATSPPTSAQSLVTDQATININTANQTGSPPQEVVVSGLTNTANEEGGVIEDQTATTACNKYQKGAPMFSRAYGNDRTVIMSLAIGEYSLKQMTATKDEGVNTTLASSGVTDANAGQLLENIYTTYLVKEKVYTVLADSGGGACLQASEVITNSKESLGIYAEKIRVAIIDSGGGIVKSLACQEAIIASKNDFTGYYVVLT